MQLPTAEHEVCKLSQSEKSEEAQPQDEPKNKAAGSSKYTSLALLGILSQEEW